GSVRGAEWGGGGGDPGGRGGALGVGCRANAEAKGNGVGPAGPPAGPPASGAKYTLSRSFPVVTLRCFAQGALPASVPAGLPKYGFAITTIPVLLGRGTAMRSRSRPVVR